MTAKLEFKVDINNTLKAHFTDSLKDHYHQVMAREIICSHPTLNLGPNVKSRSMKHQIMQYEMSNHAV